MRTKTFIVENPKGESVTMNTNITRSIALTDAAAAYVIAVYAVDYSLNQEDAGYTRAQGIKVEKARRRIESLTRSRVAAQRLLTYLSTFEDTLYRSLDVTERSEKAAAERRALGLNEAQWRSRIVAEFEQYTPFTPRSRRKGR